MTESHPAQLTLRQLRYFVGIVEVGNMTLAAGRMRVAATALSLQVKTMEERLGVPLLQRHSRGVRPTEKGRELYERGCEILRLVGETERVIAGSEDAPAPPVRLGLPPSILRTLGIDLLLKGTERFGEDGLQFVEGVSIDLVRRLEAAEIDLAIVSGPDATPSMQALDLFEEDMVFITSPRHARRGGSVSLAEVLASDLVFFGQQTGIWTAVHDAARSVGLPVRSESTVGSIDLIRHLVGQGLATSIQPYGVVEEESRRGELAVHRIDDHPIRRRLVLVWLPDNTARLAAAVDLVATTVGGLHRRVPDPPALMAGQ